MVQRIPVYLWPSSALMLASYIIIGRSTRLRNWHGVVLLMKLQTSKIFTSFSSIILFCTKLLCLFNLLQSVTIPCLSLSGLGQLFLSVMNWHFWRVPVRYFAECPPGGFIFLKFSRDYFKITYIGQFYHRNVTFSVNHIRVQCSPWLFDKMVSIRCLHGNVNSFCN